MQEKLYRNINGSTIELDNQSYESFYERLQERKDNYLKDFKQNKINEIKERTKQIFYTEYPLHRQNNIAIFGTDEEKLAFKTFYDEKIEVYRQQIAQIQSATDIEEIKNI